MQILPVQYQVSKNKVIKAQNINRLAKPSMPQYNNVSNVFYYPVSFNGVTFETRVIKKAAKNMFPKLGGVFSKDGKYIDLKKITYENLVSQKLDITKASKDKVTAYRFFLALMEGYAKNPEDTADFATQWVKKYNPDNSSSPLALLHFLSDNVTKETIFAKNRVILKDPKQCNHLDIPVFDNKGNFTLNGVLFDTETTGTHIDRDKIVQLGAIIMKKGKVAKQYNQLINPDGIHIPEEATSVNGITDEMVKNSPTMEKEINNFARNILNDNNGVIITWNGVKFDIPLLNRIIREIRCEKDINQSNEMNSIVSEKPLYDVLDVQILHQRIHPFLGASKKLGLQYHWLFCKPMEDAHDALSDCKGTMSILEYDCRMLNKLRKDKSKPLTLRQILQFQNGEPEVPNINLPLHEIKGFNTNVKFYPSYRRENLDLVNYFDKYDLSDELIYSLEKQIGSDNIKKFEESGIINSKVDDTYKGHQLSSKETKKRPKERQKMSLGYEMRKNLEILFDIAGIDGYNGKSKEEIREIIAKHSMTYTSTAENTLSSRKLRRGLWIKNVNPDDVSQGNDLPDDEITKIVMSKK